MQTGEEYYRRYLAGQTEAFDELIRLYRGGLTFFIQRIVGDPHTAEDLAADVFVQLLVYPRRYDFRCSLKTYLYMLGRSRALDYLRRLNRFRFDPLPEDYPADRTLEEQFLVDQRRRAVHRALGQLPRLQRQALHLVYFENLTYREAAVVLKKKPKQVDNLLYHGRQALKELLKDDMAWMYNL